MPKSENSHKKCKQHKQNNKCCKCCNCKKNKLPFIDYIEPKMGSKTCTNLVIYGHCLSKINSVNVGDMIIEKFTIINDNEVKVHINEIETEEENVLITVGTKCVSNGVFYKILNGPVITNIDPSSGPLDSSASITINGMNLATIKFIIINDCTFDASNSNFVTAISNTVVSFILPSKFNTQNIAISVVTFGGTSNIVFYMGIPLPVI